MLQPGVILFVIVVCERGGQLLVRAGERGCVLLPTCLQRYCNPKLLARCLIASFSGECLESFHQYVGPVVYYLLCEPVLRVDQGK